MKRSTSQSLRLESAKTTSERAYERLRQAILNGDLPAGERLTEVALAELLDVSRTPVRDALARLTHDGLVCSGKSGGLEVADPADEILDIYYIRQSLEGCSARLAAMRANEDEIEEIIRLADASQALDASNVTERARLNSAFHLTICQAARAPRLERLINDYRELFTSPHVLRRYSTEETRKAMHDHSLIAMAIKSRDPEMAEIAMRNHLRGAHDRIARMAEPAAEGKPA